MDGSFEEDFDIDKSVTTEFDKGNKYGDNMSEVGTVMNMG